LILNAHRSAPSLVSLFEPHRAAREHDPTEHRAVATFRIAVNMEFVRSADLDFRAGVKVAAELGYEYVEPMVHTGYELLSEVGYFHSFSMEEDPALMKEIVDKAGVKVSSLSAHSPLMKPEAAVSRLTRAAVLADYVGTEFLNSDEMLKPDWMDDAEAHEAMKYSLKRLSHVLDRHRKYLCIEPHGIYTKTAAGLLRIVDLVPSPWIGVNWDTGNSYLAGLEDPYDGLETVVDHVRHVHAKDISFEHAEKERGTVTGTPVGCACGEGVVDWDRVIAILSRLEREITLSVECGTIDQAERSLPFLRQLVKKHEAVTV
jgi:sugar phosphate isomerase/epimerase